MQQNVDIHTGMTKAAIIKLLGTPDKIQILDNKEIFIYFFSHLNPNPLVNDHLDIKDYYKLGGIERSDFRLMRNPRSSFDNYKYEIIITNEIVIKIKTTRSSYKSKQHSFFF